MESLLNFIKESDLLKSVERQTQIHSGGRKENSAEHSWHLAMAVFVFHSATKSEADLLKCLKMAIFHDLVEIAAGDTFVYGDQSAQKEKELLALKRLSELLPPQVADDLTATWKEFDEGKSAEACFVRALDRFLPVYSNLLNQGHSWKHHGISEAQVKSKNQPLIETAIPELWAITEKMVTEHFSES